MFYYQTHTWTNDESTHGPRDPKSLVRTSWYAPWISQSLKDHIWIQLGLGHTTKQIYDKHKTIWWECVNVEKLWLRMTSFDNKILHIWIGNIRKVVDGCTKTLSFQFDLGFYIIWNMYFIFKKLVKLMGFKSHSHQASKHWCDVIPWLHMAIMEQFPWMPHLTQGSKLFNVYQNPITMSPFFFKNYLVLLTM
jgi:hypothetical protein